MFNFTYRVTVNTDIPTTECPINKTELTTIGNFSICPIFWAFSSFRKVSDQET